MIKVGDRISSVIASQVVTGIVVDVTATKISWSVLDWPLNWLGGKRNIGGQRVDVIETEGIEWISGTDPSSQDALLAAHLLAKSAPE